MIHRRSQRSRHLLRKSFQPKCCVCERGRKLSSIFSQRWAVFHLDFHLSVWVCALRVCVYAIEMRDEFYNPWEWMRLRKCNRNTHTHTQQGATRVPVTYRTGNQIRAYHCHRSCGDLHTPLCVLSIETIKPTTKKKEFYFFFWWYLFTYIKCVWGWS